MNEMEDLNLVHMCNFTLLSVLKSVVNLHIVEVIYSTSICIFVRAMNELSCVKY